MFSHNSVSDRTPIEIEALATKLRKERNRSLKRNVLVSILVRSLSILVPLVMVPILLRYLGKELYGVFELLSGFSIWLGMGNVGLSYGLMNFLTVCFAEDDQAKAKELISTFFVVSLVLLGVMTVVGFLATFTLPWTSLLKLSVPISGAELDLVLCAAVLFTLLTVFCGIMDAVYGADQNFALVSIWDSASKVLATLAVVVLSFTKWGLLGAVVAGIGVPALVKLVGVVDLFQFRLPRIKPNIAFYRGQLLRVLLIDGVLMLFLTLSFAGIFQIDKMFLGVLIGATAVATFSIMAKIFVLALGIYALTFRSLWPAYTEAVHRGDFAWVKRWLMISTSAGLSIILFVGVTLDLFGKPIYHVWLKNADFIPTAGLALSFTACFAMWVWVTSHAALLNAARILRPQITILAAHAVLTVAIMPFLVLRWQVNGAACAPFVAGLATSGWGYPWLVRKHVFCSK